MTRRRVDPNDPIQTGERAPHVIINRQESGRLSDSAERPELVLLGRRVPAVARRAAAGRSGWRQSSTRRTTPSRIVPSLERVFFSLASMFATDQIRHAAQQRQPLDRPRLRQVAAQVPCSATSRAQNCVLCDERCRPPNVLCVGCP